MVNNKKYSSPMKCKHCKNETLFEIKLKYLRTIYEEASDIAFMVNSTLYECQTCNLLSLYQASIMANDRHIDAIPNDQIGDYIDEYGQGRWLYPTKTETSDIPNPSPDMPDDLVNDYEEAKNVFPYSPKASAALLRLVLQKLLRHLGQGGKNINDDIKALVKQGLPIRVQQALDSVRVIGNEAVHPGQINLNDNPEIAQALFKLINFIVDDMITRPREIQEIYNILPEEKRKQIEIRDMQP
jgi:Domain of unknown function (DUF4145)